MMKRFSTCYLMLTAILFLCTTTVHAEARYFTVIIQGITPTENAGEDACKVQEHGSGYKTGTYSFKGVSEIKEIQSIGGNVWSRSKCYSTLKDPEILNSALFCALSGVDQVGPMSEPGCEFRATERWIEFSGEAFIRDFSGLHCSFVCYFHNE